MMNNNLLGGNHCLLRRESFGGTLFFVKTGKRFYITVGEYESIVENGGLTAKLVNEFHASCSKVIVREPIVLPKNNFSAPDTIFLEVTRACNLACVHCFNSSGKAILDQLTQTQIEEAIVDLASAGIQEIRFTGGEPMVHPAIVQFIRIASGLGLRSSMGTNVMLINEKKADLLTEAGLRSVIVSIDGLEKRHDLIRGKNSFRLTVDGLNRLRSRNIDVRVNIVVMRSNLQDIEPFVEFLSNAGIAVFLRRLIISGRAANAAEEMVTEHEYALLRDKLHPYLNDPRGLVDGHYLSEKKIKTRIPLPFSRKECSAGHRGMVILPDGSVQSCGFLGPLGELSVGRVPIERFADIWRRLIESDHISLLERNLSSFNNNTFGPKTNCLAVALAGKESQLMQIRIPHRAEKVS